MLKAKLILFFSLMLLVVSCSNLEASEYYGKLETPTKLVERGFFIGPDFGFLFLINNDTSADPVGFITGVTMGYDINRYLSIIGLSDFAIVQAGNDLMGGINFFLLNGGLKGTYPLTERFWPYLRGLAGLFFTVPNVKDSTATDGSGNLLFANTKTKTMNMMFGLGFIYYMAKRHFSFEFSTDYVYVKDYPFDAINVSGSLRYTF